MSTRWATSRHTTDIVNVLIAGSASAGLAMAEGARLLRIPGNWSSRQRAPRGQTPWFTPDFAPAESAERLGNFYLHVQRLMASARALERIRKIGRANARVSCTASLSFPPATPGAQRDRRGCSQPAGWARDSWRPAFAVPWNSSVFPATTSATAPRMLLLFDRLGLDRCRFEMINICAIIWGGRSPRTNRSWLRPGISCGNPSSGLVSWARCGRHDEDG